MSTRARQSVTTVRPKRRLPSIVAREESIVATCSTRLTPSLTVFLRLPMPDATTARRAVLLVMPGIGAANADAALAARAIPASHAGATPDAAPVTSLSIADLRPERTGLHDPRPRPHGRWQRGGAERSGVLQRWRKGTLLDTGLA